MNKDMMIYRAGLAACLLGACLMTAVPANAAEPARGAETAGIGKDAKGGELVNQAIAAHGGREALAKMKSIYMRGYVSLYQQDLDGPIKIFFQSPRRLRVESSIHKSPETRILNGAKGWVSVGTKAFKEADPTSYEGMLFRYNYMDLPFRLIKGEMSVEYKGKEKAGRMTNDLLLLRERDGREITLHIDEKSHLISKVSAPVTVKSGKTDMSVELSDYRQVDGVKVPWKIVNYLGKAAVTKTAVGEFVINREMDDKLFNP